MTSDGETRDRLLLAGERLFADRGFKKVTVREICRTARANVAAVNYHFGDKMGLYTEVVERCLAVLEETTTKAIAAGQGADPETQLRAFVRLVSDAGTGSAIAGLIGQAQTDPELSAAFSEHYSAPRRALAHNAFEKARDRGQLRDDIDLGILVDQLWGACYNRLLVPDAGHTPTLGRARR